MHDRNPRALTGYAPRMVRENPPSPERGSIFGDTYDGVPNPQVPFQHPYPTRYHGAVFTYPMPGNMYMGNPYVKAPFMGVEIGGYGMRSLTGSAGIDAIIGTLAAYVGAPNQKQALLYAAVGGLAGYFFGGVGILGVLGAEILQMHQASGARPELPLVGEQK